MITTIGSLVQETSHKRWMIASSIYVGACVLSSLALGAVLSATRLIVATFLFCPAADCSPHPSSAPLLALASGLLGLCAVAYAASDIGLIPLPRPRLMRAVPLRWWQRWRPYGAAAIYGAALGLGITTAIPFGAFYVLCGVCMLRGDILYGACLMATYGLARSIVLLPLSWGVYGDHPPSHPFERITRILGLGRKARWAEAFLLMVFGIQLLFSGIG